MKKSKPRSSDPIPLLPTQKQVNKLILGWQKTLPIHISDLFTRETDKGIERYDTFKLKPEYLSFIVKNLNSSSDSDKDIIQTISVIMGKGKSKEDKPTSHNGPSHHIFKPVLEVVFLKENPDGNGKKRHKLYFDLDPEPRPFVLLHPVTKNKKVKKSNKKVTQLDTKQQISPKVAELFILKWQSLTDGEVINAFEGLTADNISTEIIKPKKGRNSQKHDTLQITYNEQKIRRVKSYTYDTVETQAILNVLKHSNKPQFFVSLGAGLTVPDFHPFNFRPIIRIVSQPNTSFTNTKTAEEDPGTTYFDTSKPCPPFCPG